MINPVYLFSILTIGTIILKILFTKKRKLFVLIDPLTTYLFILFIFYGLINIMSLIYNFNINYHTSVNASILERTWWFLNLWVIFVLFGYSANKKRYFNQEAVIVIPSKKKFLFFSIFQIIVLVIYIINNGGFYIFITSLRDYVYYINDQWDTSFSLYRLINFLCGIEFLLSVLVAARWQGLLIQNGMKPSIYLYLAILPAILVKIALYSRGTFLYLLIYWLIVKIYSKKFNRRNLLALIILTILLILGILFGMSMRSNEGISINNAFILILDAFNGFTVLVDSIAITPDHNYVKGIIDVFAQLNPLPSFFGFYRPEDNLTTLIYGNMSGSSMPFPAIGELYYRIGFLSLIFAFLLGYWLKTLSQHIIKSQNIKIVWIFFYFATLMGTIYSVHSALRAVTRYVLWVFLVYMFVKLVYRVIPIRKVVHDRK